MESALFTELTNTDQERLSGGVKVTTGSAWKFDYKYWDCYTTDYDDYWDDYIWTCYPALN